MSVLARFAVASVTKSATTGTTVKMVALHDPSIPEERRLSKSQVTGSVVMFIDNPAAEAFFHVSKECYVEFRSVEDDRARSA